MGKINQSDAVFESTQAQQGLTSTLEEARRNAFSLANLVRSASSAYSASETVLDDDVGPMSGPDSSQPGVRIASTIELPRAPLLPVVVHYRTHGRDVSKIVIVSQAIRFDDLVIATVDHITEPIPAPEVTIDSAKNGIRWAYHGVKTASLSRAIAPARFEYPVLDTRLAEPGNMAHLLINLLPYCLHVQEVLDPRAIFIFRKMQPRFANLCRLLNVKPTFENRRLEGNIVKVCGTRGIATYSLINTNDVWPTAFLPHVYDKFDFSCATQFPKVFFARRGDRALLNHDATRELVERFGYKTVFMEDYSLEEQLSIGANAKHVVAVHGAAMSFLVMARRIESVIELMPAHNYSEYYPVSLGERVIRYEQIIPLFDPRIGHLGWGNVMHHKSQPFAVNLALLLQRLELFG